MKILFCDYDSTLCPDLGSITGRRTFSKNINSVKDFVKENKFIITTGRNLDSILKEVNKYNIDYNYITAYDGRVSINKNRIIHTEYIYAEILSKLKTLLEDSTLIKNIYLYNEQNITNKLENIIYIAVYPKNYTELYKRLEEIQELYPNLQIESKYFNKVIFIAMSYNKLLGAKKLIEKENISVEDKNIYAVGDETNDLELLKEYNGYKMLISNPKLYMEDIKTTTSVHRLIKKIEKY